MAALRRERKLTQKALAQLAGVDAGTIKRLEGEVFVSLDTANRVVQVLGPSAKDCIVQERGPEKRMVESAMYQGMHRALEEEAPDRIWVTSFQKGNPFNAAKTEMLKYHQALSQHLRHSGAEFQRIVAVHTLEKLVWIPEMLRDLSGPGMKTSVRVLDCPTAFANEAVPLPPIFQILGSRLFLANPHAIVPEHDPCILIENETAKDFFIDYFATLWDASEHREVLRGGEIQRDVLHEIVGARSTSLIEHHRRSGHATRTVSDDLSSVLQAYPTWLDALRPADDSKPYRRVMLSSPGSGLEVMLAFWNSERAPCLAHDHGGGRGTVQVLRGEAEVTTFDFNRREGSGLWLKARAPEPLPKGTRDEVTRDTVHSMRPTTTELITLHVYLHSAEPMLVFDESRQKAVRVRQGCGAWWPAATDRVPGSEFSVRFE